MDTIEVRERFPATEQTSFNPKHAVAWIEEKPLASQALFASDIFQELYKSAAKPKQSSGNACVKLCGFIDLCAKSQSTQLSEFAFAEKTAWDLFNFFIEWNEQDQHRSMRLVLEFLNLFITRNPNRGNGSRIKTRVLNDTISMITLQSTRPSIKSAMIALDYFLQKKVLYLSGMLEIYCEIHQAPQEPEASCNEFITKVFSWMSSKNVWPQAGKLLITIFTSPWSESENRTFLPDAWHKYLSRELKENAELLQPIKLYILTPLFKVDKAQCLKYLQDLSSLQTLTTKENTDLDVNSVLWLATLEAGKKVGVVDEANTVRQQLHGGNGVAQLEPSVLEDILSHSSHEARSSAVSIFIASPSTTKPYTSRALDMLRKHLPAFHADTDAKFRYDVLGHSRNMITRIMGAISFLRKECERNLKKAEKMASKPRITENGQPGQPKEAKVPKRTVPVDCNLTLQQHDAFVRWYLEFLKHELVPTASYQRHITALKATGFVLASGLLQEGQDRTTGTEKSFVLVDAAWLRSILDLIMDPFDDVRETAASLLRQLSSTTTSETGADNHAGLPVSLSKDIDELCQRSNELASKTARADHSDGVARSYELLCHWTMSGKENLLILERIIADLERKLFAAECDLALAVLEAPVQGNFASLRYIWEALPVMKHYQQEVDAFSSLQKRAVSCCDRIWQAVRHVLCDDSPEGHLPEELEEVDGLDTKDLLSYSFRAIHESSNLLRAIASNARPGIPRVYSPTSSDFETIGNLTFDQLSNLRHRGALTTVSQTFASCCQLVKYYSAASTEQGNALGKWYKGTITCIYAQASTTRRSAGIPALMVGLLSANAGHPSLHTVIQELQKIARPQARRAETDGSNLPQVHAMNCLNNIFKSSHLSKKAEPYLTDCFQLATDSLKSEVWSIRNCGLLLLRSLIDCLFGTNESKASIEEGWDGRTTKIAWHKYEALPPLLVGLLEIGQQTGEPTETTSTAESVFPALDVIRRAGPPEHFKDQLYDIISWYLGSHLWHVREIAARTLCSFLLKPDWIKPVQDLLEQSRCSANKLHGSLLTLKFLLEKLYEVLPGDLFKQCPNYLLAILEKVTHAGSSYENCPEARAVYYEIITFVNELDSTSTSGQKGDSSLLIPPKSDTRDQRHPPSALLSSKREQAVAAYTLRRSLQLATSESEQPDECTTHSAPSSDINVACDILGTLSTSLAPNSNVISVSKHLIITCVDTCFQIEAPEPRVLALEILSEQLDVVLGKKDMNATSTTIDTLPLKKELTKLWADLQAKALNPSLADAILRVSGPLLATITLLSSPSEPVCEDWLRSWGQMMSEAGQATNGFDTRMAAIQSIASLSFHTDPSAINKTANLPWLLALYDALNDDDDEVRDVAAAATIPILGKSLVSMEAAARMLSWLGRHFGQTSEFRTHVACRLIGHSILTSEISEAVLKQWTPAGKQLDVAMVFDDSLFVIEEQNLYIDEVRETQRWKDVFAVVGYAEDGVALQALTQWTLSGLEILTKLAATDDGPLGWTSKPEVFAICSRIVITGAALAKRNEAVKEELRKFWAAGQSSRVHGTLLSMCDSE